jgi:hypothetical protein
MEKKRDPGSGEEQEAGNKVRCRKLREKGKKGEKKRVLRPGDNLQREFISSCN